MIPTGSSGLDALFGGYRPGTITYFAVEQDAGCTLLARAAVKAAATAVYVGFDWPMSEARVVQVAPPTIDDVRRAVLAATDLADLVVVDDPQAVDLGRPGWADDHRAVQGAWFEAMREVGPIVARSETAVLFVGRDSPPIFAIERRASTVGHVKRLHTFGQGIEKLGHWVEVEVGDRTTRVPLLYTGAFDSVLEGRRARK